MFAWLRKKASQSSNVGAPLYFKDNLSAFEYACQFLSSELKAGAYLPALVQDATALLGHGEPVKRQKDGNQIAMLKVCSSDGGFTVLASSASPKGPSLQVGDLVIWQAGASVPAMASQVKDLRSTWVGLIVAKLQPEYTVGRGWAIQQQFKP